MSLEINYMQKHGVYRIKGMEFNLQDKCYIAFNASSALNLIMYWANTQKS